MSRNSAIFVAILSTISLVRCQTTPPAVTPDPNFKCPADEGLYSHPSDCTKFYECANGLAWLLRCDGGLYFNPVIGMCDYPANVDCKNAASHKGHIKGQECIGEGNYTCTENGAFPHEELCEFYYDCWEEYATLCVCTDGMLFDLTYSGCNYPESVDCGSRIRPEPGTGPTPPPKSTTTTTKGTGPTQPPPDFECPKDEGLFPNPKDCSSYYQCNGGYPFLENCPPTLVFNPRELICDYPANVPECSSTGTQPPATTTTRGPDPPTPSQGPNPTTDRPDPTSGSVSTQRPTPPVTKPTPGDFQCPDQDGYYADPNDCHSFYACFGGESLLLTCPDGLAFNEELQACDYPENVPGCSSR